MQIAILGAGMVGRAIATDLAKDYAVTSFDNSDRSLKMLTLSGNAVKTVNADLRNFENYENLLPGFDIVVNAVPGFMGFKALEAVIKAGKNIVDISFFPENALDLHALAKSSGVTAIVDCGVAPGMSNLILGYYDSLMQIEDFECLVGGLPKKRAMPFQYKAPFSPVDVIEEYLRPARYVEHKNIITKPALSDAELVDFESVGTLEAFNTDGLRSILYTMPHIPHMKEKTLRYPGHIDLIIALKSAGFFGTEQMKVKGTSIVPLDFTTSLLFDSWKLKEEDEEFTIMKITIKGRLNNEPTRIEYNLFDEYDFKTSTTSMSRTTGYTCTAAVNMLIRKLFTEKGIFPPELVGRNKTCFDFILNYLSERNVIYKKSVS